MKAKLSLIAQPVAALLLACNAGLVSASDYYQMAIVQATPGAADIQSGAIEQGLLKLGETSANSSDLFGKTMALCVANTRLAEYDTAMPACNRAVHLARTNALASSAERREMQALALTNRGVLHWVSHDVAKAQQDFQRAAQLSDSALVQNNLQQFEGRLQNLMAKTTASTM